MNVQEIETEIEIFAENPQKAVTYTHKLNVFSVYDTFVRVKIKKR